VEPRLAVVGATGLVGSVIRQVLVDRKFPYRSVKFLASSKSPGRTIDFDGRQHPVQPLSADAFAEVDIVLSSTPGSVSREFSPIAAKAGAVVVDNSSAWRMDPGTPLVVPEVNAHDISKHKGIIANPNCAAIQLVVALKPLHDAAKIKRVVVSTYQSSSGKGAAALAELDSQVAAIGRGEPVPSAKAHRHQLAGNCIPNDWVPGEDGYSEEETKIMMETRKIMGDDSLRISATCVRVPVRVGHGEAVNIEFENPISPDEARAILRKAPGVIVLDGDEGVPLQQTAAGRDETFVGRIRRDPSVEHGLNIWVVADNLRKGAATNAVQIAEHLLPMIGKR
jgi:aspartate-semialdehyde dehydrogenase